MNLSPVKSKRSADDSNMIPLINVVFLMLIFFMIAGQIRPAAPIEVSSPISSSELSMDQVSIELFIGMDGAIYQAGQLVSLKTLAAEIEKSDLRLVVDQAMASEVILPILTELKKMGVAALSIRTELNAAGVGQ